MKKLEWLCKHPLISGMIASSLMLGFYFGVLSIANSPEHAVSQFLAMWYWIVALSVGFGIQVGLYAKITARQMSTKTSGMMASGGVSAVSMVACCAHHASDVLPLLGLAAASAFLDKYQTIFLAIGLLSNLAGITFLLDTLRKDGEKNAAKTCH